jgi:GxxExxY protein
MPVQTEVEIPQLSQDEFAEIAYRVVGTLFEIHADFGRLFDEGIYQEELVQRLPEARKEVRLTASFDTFTTTYFIDLLMDGTIFELKTAEAIVPRHRAQLLNYLLLTDSAHGKIVKMRPSKIQHEFFNSSLHRADRVTFSIEENDWREYGTMDLKVWLTELLHDLGVGLDLNLYRDAVLHHFSATSAISNIEIYGRDKNILGHQEQSLINPATALRISAVDPNNLPSFERQLRRFLSHTALTSIQWINLTRSVVTFRTLRA